MTLTHPHVVLLMVVLGVTLSTICLSLSSFFYLTAVREGASIAEELQQQQEILQDLLQQYDHTLNTEEEDVPLAELDEDTSLRMLDPRLSQHRVLQKKKTIQESFIIVCQPGKVLPPPGYTTGEEDGKLPTPWYYDGLTGSELVLRGVVFDGEAYTLAEILATGPKKLQDSYYTQKCTAVKAKTTKFPNRIEENMCEFTLCYKHPTTNKKGCLYLHAASKFEFQPGNNDDTTPIPTVRAVIIGGSGHFEKYYGGAVLDTVLRSTDNAGQYVGFELTVYYKKQTNYPKYTNPNANTRRSAGRGEDATENEDRSTILPFDPATGLVHISEQLKTIVNVGFDGPEGARGGADNDTDTVNKNNIILS